jgi:hypothetical protein
VIHLPLCGSPHPLGQPFPSGHALRPTTPVSDLAAASALLRIDPGVSDETVAVRLAYRMERQRRVLMRDIPPLAWFLVDQLSLYRLLGSPEVMAAQMRHLRDVAVSPNVTLQILPAVANLGVTSGFVIADESAYAEHVAAGFVYTGENVSGLRIFDSLRTEAYRGSESLRILEGS